MALSQRDFSERLEVSENSQTAYEKGKTPPTVEYLFRLADHGIDICQLLTGHRAGIGPDDGASDWAFVPEYDLANFDPKAGKGMPLRTARVPVDWLMSSFAMSEGLWIARAPNDYSAMGFVAGDPIVCADMTRQRLFEGAPCIWWFQPFDRLLVARYSIIHRGNDVFYRDGQDIWVNPQLVEGDDRGGAGDFIPVGVVMGKPFEKV